MALMWQMVTNCLDDKRKKKTKLAVTHSDIDFSNIK